jgi:hypothetical protein
MSSLRVALVASSVAVALGLAPVLPTADIRAAAEPVHYARCDTEVHTVLGWEDVVLVDQAQVALLNSSELAASFKRELTEDELRACEPDDDRRRAVQQMTCYLVARNVRDDAAVPGAAQLALRAWVAAADSDGVAGMPSGLDEVTTAHIQLQPLTTPNNVELTLYYDEAGLGDIDEHTLRMFLFDADNNVMVEIPAVVDAEAYSVTARGIDVSAFADAYHHVGLFG